jgi:hypothetical protein
MAEQGKTSDAIHRETNIIIAPGVLQDILRDVRRNVSSHESDDLSAMASQCEQFHTSVVTDHAHLFVAFYAANRKFNGTDICRGTFIMDDTACTNHFDLPLFAVIGIDEHGHNQLLGFAFLKDQTAPQFANYLRWLQRMLTDEGQAPISPTAIVVDRHEGQFKGIQQVFPDTHIIFCVKHLGANIRATFRKGPMRNQFWRLIKLKINLSDWTTFLTSQTQRTLTGSQTRMIQWLAGHGENYAPHLTFRWTGEQVTSRVEGFFGTLKCRINHSRQTLAVVAKACMDLGIEAMRKRLEPQTPTFCDTQILDSDLQADLGIKSRKLLLGEIEKLQDRDLHANVPPLKIKDHNCCPLAKRWRFPCVHVLISREHLVPRLTERNFPPNVFLKHHPIHSQGTHEILHNAPDRTSREPLWTPQGLFRYMTPLFNRASRGDPSAQEIIMKANSDCAELPPEEYHEDGIVDPLVKHGPGRPDAHPRDRSRLDGNARKKSPRRDPESFGQIPHHCRICGLSGHNVRTCPRKLQ